MQPPHTLISAAFFGLVLGLSACPTPQAGDDESECIPGEEGCACNEGQCLAGLVCLSDLCVEEPDSLTSGVEDTAGDSGPKPDLGADDGDVTTGDGDMGCLTNSECAGTEACVDGTCYDTDALYFDVFVDYFYPTVCRDGVGGAELYYDAYMSDALQLSSSTASCPGSWIDTWVYDSVQSLRIEFWELDQFVDDNIVNLCWQDANQECTRVPKDILHNYGFDGFIDGHEVVLSFYPRLDPG